MGWNSGGPLMDAIIETLTANVEDHDDRVRIYTDIIIAMQDMDCDVLEECKGVDDAFDEALEKIEEE